MKLKYTSYHPTILLILLLTLNAFNSAKAEYVMTITGGEVPAQEGITIEILIENAGDFTAFQVDIPIPEQFSYVEDSAVLNPDRIANHTLHADVVEGNILRFICFSLTNASFLGNTGSVASFELIAGTQPGDYELTPVNPIIGIAGGENVITEAIAGVVTLLAPDIQVNPESLNFGEIPLTAYQDMAVTVQNTGNQPLEVTGISFDSPYFEVLEDDEFVLTPGNMQHLTIRFNSVEKGHYIQEMTISSNDPDEPEVVIDVEAIAFAVNELHCGSMLSFSGTKDTLTLSINNMEEFVAFQFDLELPEALTYVEGTVSLAPNRVIDHIADANVIDGNILRVVAFSLSNQAFIGEDGEVISLVFDVFGTGGWYPLNLSNVIIADVELNNILSELYNGHLEVAAPDIFAQQELNFGDVSVLDTSSELLTIHNWGSDTLFINQFQTTNDAFFIAEPTPLSILPSESFELEVFFHHPDKGNIEGILQIFSNDPDENPYLVELSAYAFAPNYMIVPDVAAFMEDVIYVDIHADNHESFVAFDFHLTFPGEVMTFLPAEEHSSLTNRAQDHLMGAAEVNDGVLRVFAYSMNNLEFFGNSGAVVRLGFAVDAPQAGMSYPLLLSEAILSDANMENLLYASIDGQLNVVDGVICPNDMHTCMGSGPITLSGAKPPGGEYSGTGVTDGIFDPEETGTGTFEINYDYEDGDGMLFSCQFFITVHDIPVVSHPDAEPVCLNEPVFQLQGGEPAGGFYIGPGINAGNWFDPMLAGEGIHEITYTYIDGNLCQGSTSFNLQVHALPVVILDDYEPVSIDSQAFELYGGLPAGGEYAGNGVNEDGWFDPAIAGEGTHEITYTYTDENACSNYATSWITVYSPDFPSTITLDEHTVADGENTCFDASETIITGGEGGWFWVQDGGNATLIAGQNIIMLPGTQVDAGGYLLARIAADEHDFCGIPKAMEYKHDDVITQIYAPDKSRNTGFFEVYPNPTQGYFTIELLLDEINSDILISIHNLQGSMLQALRLPSTRKHSLDISSHPPGIYLLRVTAGNNTDTVRLIKK